MHACFDCRLKRLSCDTKLANSNNNSSLKCSYISKLLENTQEEMEHIEYDIVINNVDINRVEYNPFNLNILKYRLT